MSATKTEQYLKRVQSLRTDMWVEYRDRTELDRAEEAMYRRRLKLVVALLDVIISMLGG